MKKTNSSLVVYSLTLVSLVSCAGNESYEAKMSRYTPKVTGKNQVPDFQAINFEFATKTRTSRMPASVEDPAPVTKIEKTPNEETTLSNKKLYFLTLIGQYEKMKKYSKEFISPDVNICPHFHTSLIEYNGRKPSGEDGLNINKIDKKFVYDKSKFNDIAYVSARAELALPLSKEEVNPKVIDILHSGKGEMNDSKINEVVHQAIDIHLSKTYSEVRELCEYGVSDNYYIYENLITHIKTNQFNAGSTQMNTLLKTTLFSNMALLTAMEKTEMSPPTPSRGLASVDDQNIVKKKEFSTPYAREVMSRLNVEWAKEYFDHLKTSR